MYGELYQYLILYKQLDLPGIGSLLVEKTPAQFVIADKIINPPAFSIVLQANTITPSKKFFNWLGSKLDITERDAVIRFNDFLFELKKQLSSGSKLEWSGIGTISKGLAGDIKLEKSLEGHSPALPVPAIKVLRENAEHIIRVGEEERTSAEMRELLNPADEESRKKAYLWTAAIIIAIISVIFIGYYFSVHGMSPSSASNQQKLVPQTETKTH
jgi:hypothetical protein